jgi:exodeoxyribonuclease VII large subunit
LQVALLTRRDVEKARCERQRERVLAAQERLRNAFRSCDVRRRRDLSAVLKLIESLSHKSVLARGFALVRAGADGPPIRSAAAVTPGQGLTLQFADGCVGATADGPDSPRETPHAEAAPSRARSVRSSRSAAILPAKQGSLF